MSIIGLILMAVGGLIAFVGYAWFLLVAGRVSIVWLLGCLIVPFVGLVFLVLNWHDAKKPFLINLAGVGILVVGLLLYGPNA